MASDRQLTLRANMLRRVRGRGLIQCNRHKIGVKRVQKTLDASKAHVNSNVSLALSSKMLGK